MHSHSLGLAFLSCCALLRSKCIKERREKTCVAGRKHEEAWMLITNWTQYSRWMPNCSFGAGTAWQSRCATSINALARYTPFFCFPIIGLYFFFRENCEKRAVSFFRVKRYCNMYIYILIEPDPEFNLTEWTSKSNHKLEINWTRPHNGTKNGWKEAIRRNGGYKTNRQRSQNRAKLGGTEWGQNFRGRD